MSEKSKELKMGASKPERVPGKNPASKVESEREKKIRETEKSLKTIEATKNAINKKLVEGETAKKEWEETTIEINKLNGEARNLKRKMDERRNAMAELRVEIAKLSSPQVKKYYELIEEYRALQTEIAAAEDSGDAKKSAKLTEKLEAIDELTDTLQPAIRELEDRISEHNLLKWFTVLRISPEIQKITKIENLLDGDDNYLPENIDAINDMEEIGEDNIVAYTSNGMVLRLDNPEVVEDADGVEIEDPRALFSVLNPEGNVQFRGVTLDKGYELMAKAAVDLQKLVIKLFDRVKDPKKSNEEEIGKIEKWIAGEIKNAGLAKSTVSKEKTKPEKAPAIKPADNDEDIFTAEELALLKVASDADEAGVQKYNQEMAELKSRKDFDFSRYGEKIEKITEQMNAQKRYIALRAELLEKKKNAPVEDLAPASEPKTVEAKSTPEELERKMVELIEKSPDLQFAVMAGGNVLNEKGHDTLGFHEYLFDAHSKKMVRASGLGFLDGNVRGGKSDVMYVPQFDRVERGNEVFIIKRLPIRGSDDGNPFLTDSRGGVHFTLALKFIKDTVETLGDAEIKNQLQSPNEDIINTVLETCAKKFIPDYYNYIAERIPKSAGAPTNPEKAPVAELETGSEKIQKIQAAINAIPEIEQSNIENLSTVAVMNAMFALVGDPEITAYSDEAYKKANQLRQTTEGWDFNFNNLRNAKEKLQKYFESIKPFIEKSEKAAAPATKTAEEKKASQELLIPFYMSMDDEGIFAGGKSFTYKPGISLFKFTPKADDTAEFSVFPDKEVIKYMKDVSIDKFRSSMIFTNALTKETTGIEIVTPGIARFDGKNWKIERQTVVTFVQGKETGSGTNPSTQPIKPSVEKNESASETIKIDPAREKEVNDLIEFVNTFTNATDTRLGQPGYEKLQRIFAINKELGYSSLEDDFYYKALYPVGSFEKNSIVNRLLAYKYADLIKNAQNKKELGEIRKLAEKDLHMKEDPASKGKMQADNTWLDGEFFRKEKTFGNEPVKEKETILNEFIEYTEYPDKFYYFDEGNRTSFMEVEGENLFSYDKNSGRVLPLKEGWKHACTNPSYFLKEFNYSPAVLSAPFDQLRFKPALIDKKGDVALKGEIMLDKSQKQEVSSAKNLEYGPAFYMGEPIKSNSESIFVKNSRLNEYREGYVVYKFSPIKNTNRAEFEFVSDSETIKIVWQNALEYIRAACKFVNDPSPNTKKVITLVKGKAELLPDGNWKVTKKAEIAFE